MSTTYTRSESIASLAGALAKAQTEIDHALKQSANPFFKSKYADLASIREACVPHLAKNGLAVLQPVRVEGAKVTVATLLLHESGEWICSELTVTAFAMARRRGRDGEDLGGEPTSERDAERPQAIGSAITYARRYGLSALVGVATADDDGNAASGVQRESAAPSRPLAGDDLVDDWMKQLAIATGTKQLELVAADISQCNLTPKMREVLTEAYRVAWTRVNGVKAPAAAEAT